MGENENANDRRGPGVDELAEAFPMVDRSTLERLRDNVSNMTYRTAAGILDEAAEMGKVPEADYTQLAAAAGSSEQLDLPDDDPLDDPPDADPNSPHNMERGQMAVAHIKQSQFAQKAEQAVAEGTLSDMIELLATVNKWANEALLDPNRTSLPDQAKTAAQTLGDGIVRRIDVLAHQGNEQALEAAYSSLAQLNNEAFREKLKDSIDDKLRLLRNSGSEYDAVRERVLSDDNSDKEAIQLYEDAVDHADITYDQAAELTADLTEWLEDYHEAKQALVDGDGDVDGDVSLSGGLT